MGIAPVVSMCGDIGVTQNVPLEPEIVHAMLDDVADADDAGQFAIFDHEYVTRTVAGHQRHDPLEAVVARRGHDTAANDLAHFHCGKVGSMARKRARDLPLRNHSDDGVAAYDCQRRDVSFAHAGCGAFHTVGWADRNDLTALLQKNGFDGHDTFNFLDPTEKFASGRSIRRKGSAAPARCWAARHGQVGGEPAAKEVRALNVRRPERPE
jgi:hypothetical protein